jgi:predicted DNA binding CopG/RHH family protein
MKKRLKPGPKPKGADAKTTVIAVKLSQRELAAFKKAAKRDGMPLSPWLIEPRRKGLKG